MGATTGARSGALTIGQLSRLTGVNIENIRYFEKVGLLSAHLRTEGGPRFYGTEHVCTLASSGVGANSASPPTRFGRSSNCVSPARRSAAGSKSAIRKIDRSNRSVLVSAL